MLKTIPGYRILEKIGEGGMCLVYLARATDPAHAGTDLAIKILRPQHAADPRYLDFFVTEADLSQLLHHENLVRTLDAGQHEGSYYIVMEHIPGADLSEVVHRTRQREALLQPDLCVYLVCEVLQGLHYLHEARGAGGQPLNLVHRDVTPHNIFIDHDGRVLLGDFGIARVAAHGTEITLARGAVGKLGYLAPEALQGQEVDRRADVYAAGVVLYELLTGRRLFAGDDQQAVMSRILDGKYPRPRRLNPRLSRGLEECVMTALARRPKDRYPNAFEMQLDLQEHFSRKKASPLALATVMHTLFRREVGLLKGMGDVG